MSNPWVNVCRLDDLPPTGGTRVAVGGRYLAIFRINDRPDGIRIFDDACPHAGGSLSSGTLDPTQRDPGAPGNFFQPPTPPGHAGCLLCPVHAYRFDLDTGRCLDHPHLRARVYPVRVVDGQVQVRAEACA